MNLAHSTFYETPPGQAPLDAVVTERIGSICAEFPAYGYRRVTAQPRHEGLVVNHKKVRRIMKEQDLSVRPRRRFVVTTDSDHDEPIFPDLARQICPIAPNVVWVADISYIAIARGFVYLPGCLVAPGCRLCPGAAEGRAPDSRGARGRDREP